MKGRVIIYGLVVVLSASVFSWLSARDAVVDRQQGDTVTLGRTVYISEGCIHCHSQYVRPVGPDTSLWGERTTVEQALGQTPVLIGNRRQGPDLANVALRRPREWNRLHLMDPRRIVPGSRMPSFAHLFAEGDPRGPALLDYLDQLKPVHESR